MPATNPFAKGHIHVRPFLAARLLDAAVAASRGTHHSTLPSSSALLRVFAPLRLCAKNRVRHVPRPGQNCPIVLLSTYANMAPTNRIRLRRARHFLRRAPLWPLFENSNYPPRGTKLLRRRERAMCAAARTAIGSASGARKSRPHTAKNTRGHPRENVAPSKV
jgi:hypothetical protein